MFSTSRLPKRQPEKPSFKPLVEYKPSDEGVIVQQQDQPPMKISRTEYNALFGVSMTYGIFYSSSYQFAVNKLLSKLGSTTSTDAPAVFAYLAHPVNYFTVCFINSTCGYGLIANENIPARTVVGIYSGELIVTPSSHEEKLSREERAYDMSVYRSIKLGAINYTATLRAKNQSDLMRFTLHSPSVSELDELPLGSDIPKKDVLTANMNYPLAICRGTPIRYFVTCEPIKKGSIASITYGSKYWKNRGNPTLFVQSKEGIRIANYSSESKHYALSSEIITDRTVLTESKTAVSSSPTLFPKINQADSLRKRRRLEPVALSTPVKVKTF